MLIGQSASSRGGVPDLSAHERVNLGAAVVFVLAQGQVPLIMQPPLAPKWLACWGWVHGGSSAVGVSNKALSTEVGTTGSLFTTSNILRSNWSPLSTTGVRHSWSSCTAPQSTPRGIPEWQYTSGEPWPAPTCLSSALLDNLKFPWSLSGEGSPFTPAPEAGWGSPQAVFFSLCGWQPEGSGLLVGQPQDLDIA